MGGSTPNSSLSSIASVKLQSGGRGARVLERAERRESVARNCSGRSDVGGGLKRLVRASGGTGGTSGGLLDEVEAWSAWGFGFEAALGSLEMLGGSDGRSKGVRCSEGGILGKEVVEKRYRSKGSDSGEWIIRNVEDTVH